MHGAGARGLRQPGCHYGEGKGPYLPHRAQGDTRYPLSGPGRTAWKRRFFVQFRQGLYRHGAYRIYHARMQEPVRPGRLRPRGRTDSAAFASVPGACERGFVPQEQYRPLYRRHVRLPRELPDPAKRAVFHGGDTGAAPVSGDTADLQRRRPCGQLRRQLLLLWPGRGRRRRSRGPRRLSDFTARGPHCHGDLPVDPVLPGNYQYPRRTAGRLQQVPQAAPADGRFEYVGVRHRVEGGNHRDGVESARTQGFSAGRGPGGSGLGVEGNFTGPHPQMDSGAQERQAGLGRGYPAPVPGSGKAPSAGDGRGVGLGAGRMGARPWTPWSGTRWS